MSPALYRRFTVPQKPVIGDSNRVLIGILPACYDLEFFMNSKRSN